MVERAWRHLHRKNEKPYMILEGWYTQLGKETELKTQN